MVAEEGYVDFRGHRTWFRRVGDDGIPLLALHGGPGSTHNYFAPLERLAGERTVVLYDQIGCGGSDRPTNFEWSVELSRDELMAVRKQLGLDRIHLLGTSWGGMLALEHVLSGAAGIVSLIFSSTLASIDEWVVEQKRLVADLPPEVRAVLDRHERAGTYDDPEYEEAMGVYGYASARRSSPTPRLTAARASLSNPGGTRHPGGTGQDVHVLELALGERVETVGSATDACEVTSPAGLRPTSARQMFA